MSHEYDRKSKYASAREWLASSERKAMLDRDRKEGDEKLVRSRRWLGRYMERPSKTGFIWTGRLTMTTKEPAESG